MTQGFGGGEAAVDGLHHHVEQQITRSIHGLLLLQQARAVHINVLTHQAYRAWVGADLDHGHDGIANDVALTCWEKVNRKP